MKLTNRGRYAVMAMADLASNAKDGPISLAEISLRQNISLAYLEQIFIKLKNNKLVRSSRCHWWLYFRKTSFRDKII